MGEVVYTSHVQIVREQGPNRSATLPAGEQVAFGVHGAIAEHYGVGDDHGSTSTTIDYVVAAAAG